MGRPPRRDWKQRAAEAQKKLRPAKHGERDLELWKAAAKDQHANTVRREIVALNFLKTVKRSNPSLNRALANLPFSIIELLARWHSFDAKGAIEACQGAAKGLYTVVQLADALAEARRKAGSSRSPSSNRENLADAALRTIRLIIEDDLWPVDPDPSSNAADAAVDFLYELRPTRRRPTTYEKVAVLIVGPYQDATLYRKRQRDWLFKAFALSLFYDHVFLLLTADPPLEDYREGIDRLQERANVAAHRPRSITVVHVPFPQPDALTDGAAEIVTTAALPPPIRDSS
jgi:hypothetical protein